MTDKRNAPAGGTAEAMMETAALTGTAISSEYFNMMAASRQAGMIWELLPEGEQDALSAENLAQLAGYSNTRSLRAAVDGLRTRGIPVLANSGGYYRPRSGPAGVAEIKRFIRRQDARAASNRKTTRLIRAQLRELERRPIDGQTTMWGGDT